MSINSNIKTYELQKFSNATDDYGNPTQAWTKVTDISASINMVHETIINNEVAYKVMIPQGVTNYKAFDPDETYRLVGDGRTFDITSWYETGMRTLLSFKAVS